MSKVIFIIFVALVSGCVSGQFAYEGKYDEFENIRERLIEAIENQSNYIVEENDTKIVNNEIQNITDCDSGCAFFSEIYFHGLKGSSKEYLVIKNNHDSDINLLNWSISDKSGREYFLILLS